MQSRGPGKPQLKETAQGRCGHLSLLCWGLRRLFSECDQGVRPALRDQPKETVLRSPLPPTKGHILLLPLQSWKKTIIFFPQICIN